MAPCWFWFGVLQCHNPTVGNQQFSSISAFSSTYGRPWCCCPLLPMLSAHSHLHSLWWIQHTAVLQFCDSPTRFCLFCLSPISTVFSPESGLDYIPPSQAIPLQVSCFFLWNLFLVFLFLFFTCILYDCHFISIDKLVEMISNNYNIQEQNGTNGSSSNGNGHPARDPYEDLVFQYFFYLNDKTVEYFGHRGVSLRLTIYSLSISCKR